jgi:TatD DNase family protein
MIDTHCHIYLPHFDDDIDEVLSRAAAAGVSDILMPAIDFSSPDAMKKRTHPDIRFFEMAGIHPCSVESLPQEQALWDWAGQPGIIGIGESGLDYYWSTEHVEHQQVSFRLHCRMARELDKPLVIHNRDSNDDMLRILAEEQDGRLRGIWHCFNGTSEEGHRAIGLGFHLGIGGVVTFKNGGVDKTVAQLPLSAMVMETDAPYLSPAPYRGMRNEPSFTHLVAEKLAEIFERTVEEIDAVTTETARTLFRLNV